MGIMVNGSTIETNEQGFLANPDDWNDAVAEELVEHYEVSHKRSLDLSARQLIDFTREFYEDKQTHPGMSELLKRIPQQDLSPQEYKDYLYRTFPEGPIQTLSMLAGLPNPGVENES